MSTTGLRIPGTAAEAMMADQMIQFGAVRWFSKIVGLGSARVLAHETHECRSDGTTDTFKARPVLSYASLNVKDPRVKNIALLSAPLFD